MKIRKMEPRMKALIIIFLTGWSIWLLFTYSIAKKLPKSLTEVFPLVKFPPPIVVIISLSAVLLGIGSLAGYIVDKTLKKMENNKKQKDY